MNKSDKKSDEEYCWSAHKVPPSIIIYVALIFLVFIAVSYFGFRSPEAVKALIFTAIGSIVPLVPVILTRVEYRLTREKLESRIIRKNNQKPFNTLFLLDQLSHIVKSHGGFKYFKEFKEDKPSRRFWKKHFSDQYSGEVKLEKEDALRIISAFEQYGISVR